MRGWIGLSTSSQTTSSSQQSLEDVGEKRARLLQRQQQQLMIEQAKLEDVQEKISVAVKQGKSLEAKRLLQERNQIQKNIQLQEGKINNLHKTHSIVATTDENLILAELMSDGAQELDHIQQKTEAVDLENVVEKYREASSQTLSFSERLADPLDSFSQYALESPDTGLDVDEELELLMQQAADEKTAGLDSIPTPKQTQHAEPDGTKQPLYQSKEKNRV